MATPIRERGIRWVEKYGEKSAYLKNEMDAQIGPGAYARWEGKDPTTGTDYYVVISPGFSKKKGYHFFTGLRKMPADHGASGKKFKHQREAMSYARETWRVPPPKDKPIKPGGYELADIMGKEIVLEPQHERKSSYNLWLVKQGMGALNMGAGKEKAPYEVELGPQVVADDICWAFKASRVMGFLPALYMRKKLVVTDVTNMPMRAQRGLNEFNGKTEEMPPAPLYAKYLPPTPEDFDKKVLKEGVLISNPLVDVRRKGGKIVSKPVENQTFGAKPGKDYSQVTWRQVRLRPTVSFPNPETFMKSAPLWRELLDMAASYPREPAGAYHNCGSKAPGETMPVVELPSDDDFDIVRFAQAGDIKAVRRIQGQPRTDPISVRVSLKPELFAEFRERCLKYVENPAMVYVSAKGDEKNLVDLMDFYREKGEEFPWDQPFFEKIRARGGQLLAFDREFLLPDALMVTQKGRTDQEADDWGGEVSDIRYDIRKARRPDLIAKYACKKVEELGQIAELMSFVNDPFAFVGRDPTKAVRMADDKKRGKQRAKLARVASAAKALGIPMGDTFEKAVAQRAQAKPRLASMMASAISALRARKNSGQPFQEGPDDARRSSEALAALQQLEQGLKAKDAGGLAAARQAHPRVASYLWGFAALAANGLVDLSADMTCHSDTCAPERADVNITSYDINKYHMPTSPEAMASKKMSPNVQRPYVPPIKLLPHFEDKYADHVKAGRHMDPSRGMVYGPMPDALDEEEISGLPVVLPKDQMMSFIPRADGSMHQVTYGQYKLNRTEPRGKGQDRIVRGHYRIHVSPKHASVKSTDMARIYESNTFREGILVTRSQVFAERTEEAYRLRENQTCGLTEADPKDEKYRDMYSVPNLKGKKKFIGDQAYKLGKDVIWKDSVAAKLFLQKSTGIPPDGFGPFTKYTKRDVHIVDHVVADGIAYYNAVTAAQVAKGGKPPKNDHDFTPGKVSKLRSLFESGAWKDPASLGADRELARMLELAKRGEELSAKPDAELLKYGRMAKACSGAQSISQDMFSWFFGELDNVVQKPDEAFKAKTLTVWALQYQDGSYVTDHHEWALQYEDGSYLMRPAPEQEPGELPAPAEVEVFDSEVDAVERRKRALSDAKDVGGAAMQKASTLTPVPWEPEVMLFGTKDQAERRKKSEQALAQSPQQKQRTAALQVVPYAENARMPFSYHEARDFSRPVVHRSNLVTDYVKSLKPTAAPAAPIGTPPAAPAAPAAPAVVPTAPPQAPEEEPKEEQPATASALERLVRLADRLDEQGKKGEAEAIDRVIASVSSRKKE